MPLKAIYFGVDYVFNNFNARKFKIIALRIVSTDRIFTLQEDVTHGVAYDDVSLESHYCSSS